MKKAVIIFGAFAVLLVAAVAGMCYWLAQQLEAERNKNRTSAARAARWAGPGPDPGADPEEEDLLNQQQAAAATTEAK